MKTVNIKGKEYVEVAERVKYFRQSEEFKGWAIKTSLISNHDGMCMFEADIYDDNGRLISSGHAYEKEESSFINKTSYIENCETSAVGRALGFLGIGIDASIASADEIANAVENQKEKKESSKKLDFTELWEQCKKMTKEELEQKAEKVKAYSGYTDKQKEAILNIIERCLEKSNG